MKLIGKLQVIVTVWLLLFNCSMSFAAENSYQRLIIFGDDYSDTGNTYQLTHHVIPNPARYYQGRFSDGPAWDNYFAKMIGIESEDQDQFLNFAFGDSEIFRPVSKIVHDKESKRYLVPNLAMQIDRFTKKYHRFNSHDLAIIYIGSNDFIPFVRLKTDAFFKDLANQEAAQVNRIIKLGARNIIIFNVGDLTHTPYAYKIKKKTFLPLVNQYTDNLRQMIKGFNQQLAEDLKNKPVVKIYDLYQFEDNIFSAIDKGGYAYRFENKNYMLKASKPCYQNYEGDYQKIVGPVCDKPQEFFYYDDLHTTHFVNYLLAKDVYRWSNRKT
ncbi:MAG: hypothetical protein JSR33_03885 [Proteobacteria bacterium]|nr:hypothetical protein [Pseudomonadota bacterium]